MVCPLTQEYYLFWIAAALYLVATGIALSPSAPQRTLRRTLFWAFLAGGLAFQTFALYMRGESRSALPLTTPFEVLQAISWGSVLLTVMMRHLYHLRLLGSFGVGLGGGLALLALLMPHWDPVPATIQPTTSPWVSFHAALAIGSYTLFAILAMTSLMYLLQDFGLRHRRAGGFFSRLPSIRKLEGFNRALLFTAWCGLTLAVTIGTLNWWTQPSLVTPWKLIVAAAVWTAYGSVWWRQHTGTLRANHLAVWNAALFIAAIASLWPLTATPEPAPPNGAPAPLESLR